MLLFQGKEVTKAMGWKNPTYNPKHQNQIKCKDCRSPLHYEMRKDNPEAFDYPLRFKQHDCKVKNKRERNQANRELSVAAL